MKLTPPLAAALTALRNNAEFRLFMAAVAEEVNAETDRALATEGAQCHRAQGAALKLRELYKAYAEAPTALEKFQSR